MDKRYFLLKQIMDNKIESKYRFVEYLESTGSQFIKLGFSPNTNSGKTEVMASASSISGTIGLWGFINVSNIGLRIALGMSGGRWFGGVGVTSYLSAGTIDEKTKLVLDRKNNYIEMNGVGQNYTPGAVSATYEAFLFGRNDKNGDLYGTSFSGKVYYYKEYRDDGSLMLDLVPAIEIETGVAGMLDKVSGNFLTNQGSGKFLTSEQAEETYTEIDHIISDGKQWIDTGIPNTMDLIIEDEFMIDMISTPMGDGNWIIGGRLRNDKGLGIFRGINGFFNAYGSNTSPTTVTNVVPNVWASMYFSRTELYTIVDGNKVNYQVNGGVLVPSEYETNVLLGKNQVNYAGTGDDPRNMYGKRRKTKITDATNGEVLRELVAAKSDQTGQCGMLDKVNNKFYPSIGTADFIEGTL